MTAHEASFADEGRGLRIEDGNVAPGRRPRFSCLLCTRPLRVYAPPRGTRRLIYRLRRWTQIKDKCVGFSSNLRNLRDLRINLLLRRIDPLFAIFVTGGQGRRL